MAANVIKKDFIVRRTITTVDGKPRVYTYSEQELVRCKDCRNGETVNELIACGNSRMYGRFFRPDWFCADGKRRTDDG